MPGQSPSCQVRSRKRVAPAERLRQRLLAIQLKHWGRGATICRELCALHASPGQRAPYVAKQRLPKSVPTWYMSIDRGGTSALITSFVEPPGANQAAGDGLGAIYRRATVRGKPLGARTGDKFLRNLAPIHWM